MRQIAFALSGLLLFAYLGYLNLRPSSDEQKTVAVAPSTIPAPSAPLKTAKKASAPKAQRRILEQTVESTKVDEEPTVAEEQAEPATDPMHNLLKWDGQQQPPKEDSGMQIMTSETVRPDEGHHLAVTFGQDPKPNLKIERRDFVAAQPKR